MTPDLRITPWRADLADRALEGVLPAERYVEPRLMQVSHPALGVHAAPDSASEQVDQVLFGEGFNLLEDHAGWAWGQARRDGYVGYVRTEGLSARGAAPTHRVAAIRTYAFAAPSIKAQALGPYCLNSLVAVTAQDGRFAQAESGAWFIEAHLSPIGLFESDPVAVAERFLGAPYLWGGRQSLGVDCSGLVQQARFACGLASPRDTDQQRTLGREVAAQDLVRGDLVFWRGHVGIMLDAERLLHANAHHMATAIEPLAEAIERIAVGPTGAPIAYRRP